MDDMMDLIASGERKASLFRTVVRLLRYYIYFGAELF
jgi:hypothetical protein